MNVMVDLETLGTKPGSVIASIGACTFDASGVVDKFYCLVDIQDAQKQGLRIDAATVQWWLQQDDRARLEIASAQNAPVGDAYSLDAAVMSFENWLDDANGTTLWGNGASFDNALLREAFEVAGYEPPWKFWQDMCYRTVKNLRPDIKIKRSGTHHNALHDAVSQAEHLIELAKALNINL